MGISLLTMGAGNVIVLEETIKSFYGICDEIVYGDLLLFPEDREILSIYEKKYNMKIIKYPFDFIYKNGFASILNSLAEHATNDMVMYMNTSEIIDEDYGTSDIIKNNPDCNAFYFNHKTEFHRWYRCYNKKELRWNGCIHEQLEGEYKPYHKPIFMMADLEKDMYSEFKAQVFNHVKEIVYFTMYMRIVDDPDSMGETDISWLHFAKDGYESFKERLFKKGDLYNAFQIGDYYKLMEAIYKDKKIMEEKFKSSQSIEYQGSPMFLGKKPLV